MGGGYSTHYSMSSEQRCNVINSEFSLMKVYLVIDYQKRKRKKQDLLRGIKDGDPKLFRE